MSTFIDLFDHEAERLRGIESWDDLAALGRRNLERLVELLRERANAALVEQRLDDARERAALISELDALRGGISDDLPLLPRMRIELFRVGSPVAIYLGDSPGSLHAGWVPATVTHLAKGFRSEWKTARGNSGWFWEVTAVADRDLFAGQREVRFSTTEPRVLPGADLDRIRSGDSRFRRIFVANAWREWSPLWCIDRGSSIDPAKVDFERWLGD